MFLDSVGSNPHFRDRVMFIQGFLLWRTIKNLVGLTTRVGSTRDPDCTVFAKARAPAILVHIRINARAIKL